MRYATRSLSQIGYAFFCLICVIVAAATVQGEPVTWQILPFPSNSDWPGPQGSPAVTNDNQITLTGQPVRSVQTYSAPITVECEVVLEARSTTDGYFQIKFQPPGTPTNINADTAIFMFMIFRNNGSDQLAIYENQGTQPVFEAPFTFSADTVYDIRVGITSTGKLSWRINGVTYDLPNTLDVPYEEFVIEVSSWQPTAVFVVSDFSVTTGSACPDLIGTWSGELDLAPTNGDYQQSSVTLQITDQGVSNCMFRGFISGDRFRRPVAITGTVQGESAVIINLGKGGQASAVLNTDSETLVLEDFILLDGKGATLAGDLTKESSDD